jgi:hypothetical protein
MIIRKTPKLISNTLNSNHPGNQGQKSYIYSMQKMEGSF